MSTQTLIEHGPFIAGAAEPLAGEHREITNPGTGELVGRVTSRDGAGRRPRRAGRARRVQGLGAASATPTAARSSTRARRPSRRTSTSSCRSSSPSRARRSARPRSSCTRPPTRSSTTRACRARCAGSRVHNVDPGVDARVLRRPLGVVAAIVPWNFPTTLLCNKLGPAFLAGNTVVAKPADTTPLHDAAPGRDLRRGRACPPACSTSLPGAGARRRRGARAPPAACARSPSPARRRSASRSHALAAAGSKRVTLELGGSDPMIICDDADLKAAASAAAMGRFYNCGQACLAIKRLYVFESVADEVIEAVAAKAKRLRVGVGSDPDSQLGPMHTERPARRSGAPDRRERRRDPRRRRAPRGPRERLVPRADGRRSSPAATRRWRARRSSARRCRSGA